MPGFESQIPGGVEPRKESPGEVENKRAGWLLMLARYLKVSMPKGKEDEAAFERVGVLLQRRWREWALRRRGDAK